MMFRTGLSEKLFILGCFLLILNESKGQSSFFDYDTEETDQLNAFIFLAVEKSENCDFGSQHELVPFPDCQVEICSFPKNVCRFSFATAEWGCWNIPEECHADVRKGDHSGKVYPERKSGLIQSFDSTTTKKTTSTQTSTKISSKSTTETPTTTKKASTTKKMTTKNSIKSPRTTTTRSEVKKRQRQIQDGKAWAKLVRRDGPRDFHLHCCGWAVGGECRRNERFMRPMCPKACGYYRCPDGSRSENCPIKVHSSCAGAAPKTEAVLSDEFKKLMSREKSDSAPLELSFPAKTATKPTPSPSPIKKKDKKMKIAELKSYLRSLPIEQRLVTLKKLAALMPKSTFIRGYYRFTKGRYSKILRNQKATKAMKAEGNSKVSSETQEASSRKPVEIESSRESLAVAIIKRRRKELGISVKSSKDEKSVSRSNENESIGSKSTEKSSKEKSTERTTLKPRRWSKKVKKAPIATSQPLSKRSRAQRIARLRKRYRQQLKNLRLKNRRARRRRVIRLRTLRNRN